MIRTKHLTEKAKGAGETTLRIPGIYMHGIESGITGSASVVCAPIEGNEDEDEDREGNDDEGREVTVDKSTCSDWRPVCGKYRVASRYAYTW